MTTVLLYLLFESLSHLELLHIVVLTNQLLRVYRFILSKLVHHSRLVSGIVVSTRLDVLLALALAYCFLVLLLLLLQR